MNAKSIVTKVSGGLKFFQRFLPPSLREALSEDGVASYSRYSGFLIICACILWVSFLVIKNHTLPDMSSAAELVTAGNSAYVANQVKRVVAASKTGIPNGAPPPDPADPNAPQGGSDGGTN